MIGLLRGSWTMGLMLLALIFASLTDIVKAEDSTEPVVIILFMFCGVGVGIIIMQVLSACGDPLPYTCVVFFAGLMFSLLDKNNAGLFGESISEWVDIDADLLLFTFLPPLIFGEAMSLNFYHVRGGFVQAVILAGPGVLIGAALVGVIAKYMLPYDWNWNLALTFGSILSATDPVAVVALLKSAGASPKLTILIVGESLLNDGTAMVLFTIFYESLNGRLYTPASISYFFAAAAFGSVFLGLGCGILIIRWMRTAHRPLKEIDTTIQIAITITCAYLIFFVAQYVLKISGVLACCGAGIILAWLAPPIILSHETMHNVWGMIEWMLNTLIFLLAGLIIGNRVINKVAAIDWLYVILLYIILMVVRAITIAILYPWISTIGHKCTLNEAIFMSWAGLRGALGMALALLVERNCPDHLQKETSRMFFYVGGIAALTMVINATTAQQLLVYLGLLGNDSAEKNLVMQQIKKRLKRRMDSVLIEMADEFAFTPQDLDEVRESCSLLADSDLESLYRTSEYRSSKPTVPTEVLAQHPDTVSSIHSAGDIRGSSQRKSALEGVSPSFSSTSQSLSSRLPVSISKLVVPAPQQQPQTQEIRSPVAASRAASVSTAGAGLDAASLIDDDEDDLGSVTRNPVSELFGDSGNPVGLRRNTSSNALRIVSKYTNPRDMDSDPDDIDEEMDRVRHERERQSRNRMPSQGSYSFNAARTKSMSVMKADDIVRMLSMANRGSDAFLQPQLLTYVRAIFLEILRVRYWHDIERGKIPRLCHSAKFLLYSIEVGVDEVEQETGVRDWRVIKKEITEQPLSIRILSYLDENIPHSCMFGYSTYYLGKLEARREKRAVYMLTSFIDAHEHAQSKVHEFISAEGEGVDGEEIVQSPEELKVIEESKEAVAVARNLLNAMSADTVAKIRAKQAAALVLTKQAELIKNMVGEGLLTTQHAEQFLEEIGNDLQRMDKDRNKMYWEQGEMLAKKRQVLRREQAEAGAGNRSSAFSLFDWQNRSTTWSPYGDEQRGSGGAKEEIYMGPNSVTATAAQPLMHGDDRH